MPMYFFKQTCQTRLLHQEVNPDDDDAMKAERLGCVSVPKNPNIYQNNAS